MSGTGLATAYFLGGALLGLWAVVRFPALTPKSFRGVVTAFFLAGCSLSFIPALLAAAIHHGGRVGALAGLLGLVLPATTALAWSLGCFIRIICSRSFG